MKYFFSVLFILFLSGVLTLFVWRKRSQDLQTQFDPLIEEVVKNYDISPYLVRAIIWRESRFKPGIVGLAKERGLMQITPIAVREWEIKTKAPSQDLDTLFNPQTNIAIGTWYLNNALSHWRGKTLNPIPFALAEYNAGRSKVLRWADPKDPPPVEVFLKNITYPSTRKYVRVILKKYEEYSRNYFQPPWTPIFRRVFPFLFLNSEKTS